MYITYTLNNLKSEQHQSQIQIHCNRLAFVHRTVKQTVRLSNVVFSFFLVSIAANKCEFSNRVLNNFFCVSQMPHTVNMVLVAGFDIQCVFLVCSGTQYLRAPYAHFTENVCSRQYYFTRIAEKNGAKQTKNKFSESSYISKLRIINLFI